MEVNSQQALALPYSLCPRLTQRSSSTFPAQPGPQQGPSPQLLLAPSLSPCGSCIRHPHALGPSCEPCARGWSKGEGEELLGPQSINITCPA